MKKFFENKNTIDMIPEEVLKKIVMGYIICIVCLIIGIPLSIVFRSWNLFILTIAGAVLYAVYQSYILLLFLQDKIIFYDIKIKEKHGVNGTTALKYMASKFNPARIIGTDPEDESVKYTVYTASAGEENSILRVYTTDTNVSISQKNITIHKVYVTETI